MTVRELRAILFEVTEQELTIRELRNLLFEVYDQNAEVTSKLLKAILIEETQSSWRP